MSVLPIQTCKNRQKVGCASPFPGWLWLIRGVHATLPLNCFKYLCITPKLALCGKLFQLIKDIYIQASVSNQRSIQHWFKYLPDLQEMSEHVGGRCLPLHSATHPLSPLTTVCLLKIDFPPLSQQWPLTALLEDISFPSCLFRTECQFYGLST